VLRLSLLAGCHADEPVGPRLLRRLVGFLGRLPADDPLLTEYEWWVMPHINPDGARRNLSWQRDGADLYDLPAYLAGVVRELPGDDIEFGFPRYAGGRVRTDLSRCTPRCTAWVSGRAPGS
jgi:hypothetical protein